VDGGDQISGITVGRNGPVEANEVIEERPEKQ
jgi:hypothetical protein